MDHEMSEYFSEAMDCAHSEACPIEEAESFMMRITEIRNEKTALSSMCDEVLGDLRNKVKAMSADSSEMRVWSSGAAAVHSDNEADMSDALSLAIIAAAIIWMYPIFAHSEYNYGSFTVQEWAWAAKDGYLGEMIAHYLRNGGL